MEEEVKLTEKRFLYLKLKALKWWCDMIDFSGPANPFRVKGAILRYDIISRIIFELRKQKIQPLKKQALIMLLEYYYPEWRNEMDIGFTLNTMRRRDVRVRKWAASVLDRDGGLCQNCGSADNIQAHHICSWSAFPELRLSIDNGVSLCGLCHSLEHPNMSPKLFSVDNN